MAPNPLPQGGHCFAAHAADLSHQLDVTEDDPNGTETATDTYSHGPLEELLGCISLAKDETLRAFLEEHGDAEPTEDLKPLLTARV